MENFKNDASWNSKNKDHKERVKKVNVLKLNLILFFVKRPHKQGGTQMDTLDIHVESSITRDGQRWKQPMCLSTNGWMSKQNVLYVHIYSGYNIIQPQKGLSWGRGNGELLMGTESQFGKMEGVLWMDAGDGSTIVWICLVPLKCTFKNG